jgi:hypothetical protein
VLRSQRREGTMSTRTNTTEKSFEMKKEISIVFMSSSHKVKE